MGISLSLATANIYLHSAFQTNLYLPVNNNNK